MKANHNLEEQNQAREEVVTNIMKSKNESKSQPASALGTYYARCNKYHEIKE